MILFLTGLFIAIAIEGYQIATEEQRLKRNISKQKAAMLPRYKK